MFKPTAFIATALLLANGVSSAPIILTDQNFDHDTQIGGGMTTGDWFVKFYAPWCGHCKNMAPTWDALSDRLEGIVNVAKVDATKETGLAERFDIAGFPTLYFFKDNKQYRYTGARTLEAFTDFATSGYKNAASQPVAPPLTLWTKVWRQMKSFAEDFMNVVQYRTSVAAAFILIGMSFGMALVAVTRGCCTKTRKPQSSKKTQ